MSMSSERQASPRSAGVSFLTDQPVLWSQARAACSTVDSVKALATFPTARGSARRIARLIASSGAG
jgi:hypothetical protein